MPNATSGRRDAACLYLEVEPTTPACLTFRKTLDNGSKGTPVATPIDAVIGGHGQLLVHPFNDGPARQIVREDAPTYPCGAPLSAVPGVYTDQCVNVAVRERARLPRWLNCARAEWACVCVRAYVAAEARARVSMCMRWSACESACVWFSAHAGPPVYMSV